MEDLLELLIAADVGLSPCAANRQAANVQIGLHQF